MLIQLLIDQPQAALTIVQRTPVWVWGLLAGLLLLGTIQMRPRSMRLARVTLLPLVLAAFSLSGLGRDLSASGWVAPALGVWLLMAAAVLLATGATARPPVPATSPPPGASTCPAAPRRW